MSQLHRSETGFEAGLPGRALSADRCGRDSLASGTSTVAREDFRSLLFIEDPKLLPDSLQSSIEAHTGLRVVRAASFSEGLNALLRRKQTFEIAVFTICGDTSRSTHFIESMNRLAITGRVGRPLLLALSITSQMPEFVTKLERLGVPMLLRKFPDQILETIKKLLWQSRTTNSLPALIIERKAGHVVGTSVNYRGATQRLHIGPRLGALAAYLVVNRRTEHSTQALADVLEISRQSVKEYLKRLRQAFDRVRVEIGLSIRGEDIFWTKRMPGGFVHGLRATGRIEDTEDFFLPEEDCFDAARELPCHICRRKMPRSATTRSHIGWICRDCTEELSGIGEL